MAKQKLTFEKRAREKAKQDKRKEKRERRVERKQEAMNSPEQECEGDPDLAGIVAGPQPILEED